MPELTWIGKDKVKNYAAKVPLHVLEHKYNFGGTSENKIIHGDNLLALKSLLPEYEGRVKCIYIDPPYNTGNEGWIYNDNVKSPQIQKWLNQVVGKEGEDLSRHDKWLCMMYPRLKLLKKLLADDGAIFISIDYNENYNLRSICNEIFCYQSFIGEIYWESKTKSQNTITAYNKLQPKLEMILVYSKNPKKKFNLLSAGEKIYPFEDENGFYREHLLEFMNARSVRGRASMIFDITVNGVTVSPPEGRQWQIGIEQVKKFESANDLIERDGKIFVKMRPEYERVDKTEPFWGFFSKEMGTAESAKKELSEILSNHGFETVKPTKLIERLVFHATDKNSIVLDSFAGSGTTAHAVLNLNKSDGGNRKFILVEMEDYADTITAERVKRVIQGYGEVEGTGGSFDFYEVGEPLMIDGNLNERVDIEKIHAYIWYTETHTQYKKPSGNNPAYLGEFNGTGIYFHYEKNNLTTLDEEFLRSVEIKAENYLIYADECGLGEDFLRRNSITFKKIPRDIKKLWSDEQ